MHDLLTTWDAIGHPKILVLGDIILDRYTWGDAQRVSPEAPVLVLKVDTHEARLGGAASVAGLLRALDAQVTLAGVIGDDANGRVVSRLLDESGIDSSLVHRDELRPTTSKSRIIGRADGKHPHHILRIDEESDVLLTEDVQRQFAESIVNRLRRPSRYRGLGRRSLDDGIDPENARNVGCRNEMTRRDIGRQGIAGTCRVWPGRSGFAEAPEVDACNCDSGH